VTSLPCKGIYPTIVILLVALERSHCENDFMFDNSAQIAGSLPLQVRVDHHIVSSLSRRTHDEELDDLETRSKKRRAASPSRSELPTSDVEPDSAV
jgi:hypothetical protein